MGRAKEKPLDDPPTSIDEDEYRWWMEQTELLRQRRFGEVDLNSLIEELADVGNEKLHRLESSYRVLMVHLLKWQFQPRRRSRSWAGTIVRERTNIELYERRSPSLRRRAGEIVLSQYRYTLREAAAETGMPAEAFPAQCPYSLAQLRDFDWLPGQDKEEQE